METKRNYQAMFILNSRNQEETPADITNHLREMIKEIGGEILAENTLGRLEYVRVTDPSDPAGHYLTITFAGSPESNKLLNEKLRLDKRVKRVIVFSADSAAVAV